MFWGERMLRLKELRKQQKMTQQQLSSLLGITQATLSGWENEKFEIDNTSLIKCSSIFDVSVDYLLGKTDDSRTSAQILADSIKNRKTKLLAHGGNGTEYIDHISREEYESYFPDSAKKCILSNGNETTEITKEEFEKMKAFLKMLRD